MTNPADKQSAETARALMAQDIAYIKVAVDALRTETKIDIEQLKSKASDLRIDLEQLQSTVSLQMRVAWLIASAAVTALVLAVLDLVFK